MEDQENLDTAHEPKTKKKYIMYAVGILITLLCIGAALFYFLKIRSYEVANSEHPTSNEQNEELNKPIFYNMDEFIVNLSKTDNEKNYLKIALTFQLNATQNTAIIETNLPIIQDAFHVYLNALKIDDIEGSAGIFLLKQELLLRVNKIIYPAKIEDVLFRELLVQ